MKILEDSLEILKEKFICDRCLGRQFSQLLIGLTNEERGKSIRNIIAMLIDSKSIDYSKIELSNFYGFRFRHNTDFSNLKKPDKCFICNSLLDNLDVFAKKAEKKLKKIEFNNFLVGSKVPADIIEREEKLWEKIGIDYVESIKSEINRELGKRLWKIIRKPVSFKNPDVLIIADFEKNDAEIIINSLYILGYYKKLARGIPQSKWGTPGKYKTSVQEIVAKPIMKATKGKNNSFHGCGREDVNARCLDWRPFVIEIIEPKIRNISFGKIEKQINKSRKVKVSGLKVSNKFTVRRIKSEASDKTYRVLVKFKKPVGKKELKKLKSLVGVISQRTPERVVHRRADLIRRRLVKELKYKQINKKAIELKIKASAGLYIKELITGDKGRTKPSVSEILDNEAIPKDLDVIKIERPKGL
jgi:tRNA pseudouridine synthase 10